MILPGLFALLLAVQQQEELERVVRKFAMVYAAVEENYADPPDVDKLIFRGAIPGMLRALDPYSVFFDAGQFYQLRQQQQSRAEGFGTIVAVMPGRVVVLEAKQGGPAARAGIQPGDEILEVNGHRLDSLEVQELVEVLGETRRSRAQLRLMRPWSAALESVIVDPAEISQSSVERAFFLRPGIGYIKLTGFETNSTAELKEAIEQLRKEGMSKLILDLRDNHGGIVEVAVAIGGIFLKPETVMLSARGRAKAEQTYKVASDAQPYDFPMSVLVNQGTASAAEILAAALQDHHRAPLVGMQTFGKGVVQGVYPLSHGTGLALATAQYFTPSGRSIQRPFPGLHFTRETAGPGGIAPDTIVPAAGVNEWQAYIESRQVFLDFARGYAALNKNITEQFEITGEILDQFKSYLRAQNVPLNESVWSSNLRFVRQRLKVEIFNLALGVAKGDQIAAAADPQVQAGLAALDAMR